MSPWKRLLITLTFISLSFISIFLLDFQGLVLYTNGRLNIELTSPMSRCFASDLISITAPNGGEILTLYSNYNISWNGNGIGNVKIEISRDGGSSWSTLNTNAVGNSWGWVPVDGPATTQALVRISKMSDPTIFDVSDNVFTIADVPILDTSNPFGVTSNSATLKGDLRYLGGSPSVTVSFEYGKTTGYGSTSSTLIMTQGGLFSIPVTDLEPGTTYHFRAKADGSGGTGYGLDNTFHTQTQNLSVTTLPATFIGSTTATLNGSLDGIGDSNTIQLYMEWGTTTEYSNSIATAITHPSTFNINVSGLTPATLYHFRVKVIGNTTVYGDDLTFTTLSPPNVETSLATNITTTSATLNGNLVSLGKANPVQVSFEYGQTPSYGSTSVSQAMSSPGAFNIDITGLAPNKNYYFRAKADGDIWGIDDGNMAYFTTLTTPPELETNTATDIAPYSVTLNGTVTSMGTYSKVMVYFEFGTTTNYGTITNYDQFMTQMGKFSYELGVLPNTQYHYRAVIDLHQDGLIFGQDITFTTPPASPKVATNFVSDLTNNSVTLHGFLISQGTSSSVGEYFEYGTTEEYGASTSPEYSVDSGVNFDDSITGLNINTTYHFRAVADGGESGIAYGEDMVFVTGTSAPEGKIAFTSEREGLYESKVYLMAADGNTQTKMTGDIIINNTAARDYCPSCSPDGTKIAFYSSRDMNAEIYIVDMEGYLTRLTTNSYDDAWPTWSPDGSKIAFLSDRDGDWEIYLMNIDGSQQTKYAGMPYSGYIIKRISDFQVTFVPEQYSATSIDGIWSPDGHKVAFTSNIDGNTEIYVADADGSNSVRLTHNPADDIFPTWSPDGKYIAFCSNREGIPDGYGRNSSYDIYIMAIDGSNQTQITTDGTKNTFPSWTIGSWGNQAQNQIVFSTSCQSFTAGSVSEEISLQIRDAGNNPINVPSDTNINIVTTSLTGAFDINASGPFDGTITKVAIPKDGNQVSFYYKDTMAGKFKITASCNSYSSCSQDITVNAAIASQIRVETSADGKGKVVPAQNLIIGKTLKVYGITRDQFGNFVGNPADTTWSLKDITGLVADSDLNGCTGDSVILTGHQAGSAKIEAVSSGLISVDSGIVTVKAANNGGGGGDGGSGPLPANLSIVGNGSPEKVKAGETITYTIIVNNAGPGIARKVTVIYTLPSGVSLISAGGEKWQVNQSGYALTFIRYDSLYSGASASITITVVAPLIGGTITGTVSVSSDTVDTDAANNSVNLTATVTDLAREVTNIPQPVITPSVTVSPMLPVTPTTTPSFVVTLPKTTISSGEISEMMSTQTPLAPSTSTRSISWGLIFGIIVAIVAIMLVVVMILRRGGKRRSAYK